MTLPLPRSLVLVVSAWIAIPLLLGQQPTPETSWEVSGSVADASGPRRDVSVFAVGPGLLRPVKTDSQGKYHLRGSVSGLYRIRVSLQAEDPAPRPQAVRVAPGVRVPDVDFLIPKGAVIAGRVLDSGGKPLAGLLVIALATVQQGGRPAFRVRGADRTNDLGEYRLSNLAPDSYVIAASWFPAPKMEPARKRAASLRPTVPSITFYPASPERTGAIAVEVTEAQERPGVDLTVDRQPGYCIRFALGPGVPEPDSHRSVRLVNPKVAAGAPSPEANPQPGRPYQVCNVPRGDYQLRASQYARRPFRELAAIDRPVHVVDQDVDLGTVPFVPAVKIQGSLQTVTAVPLQLPDSEVYLRFTPLDRDYFPADLNPTRIEDGRFSGRLVYPGQRYRVEVFGLPVGHRLVAAEQAGRIFDPREYEAGEGELTLRIHPNGAVLEGRVTLSERHPAPQATVVLLSEAGDILAVTAADQGGYYQFEEGILDGKYRALALVGLFADAELSPWLASRFESKATPIELVVSQKRTLNLAAVQVR